jgi:hypothetical protein
MPRFDKTGPNGEGPMTGKGFGRCNENRDDLRNRSRFGRRLNMLYDLDRIGAARQLRKNRRRRRNNV